MTAACGSITCGAADRRTVCRGLARPPSRSTRHVRPCKLRGVVHAATGPATVSGQGSVELVGASSSKEAFSGRSAAVCSFFNESTSKLSGAVSLPIAGPLAAWMPPSSLHGRTCGVSRERRGHRAIGPLGVYPDPSRPALLETLRQLLKIARSIRQQAHVLKTQKAPRGAFRRSAVSADQFQLSTTLPALPSSIRSKPFWKSSIGS